MSVTEFKPHEFNPNEFKPHPDMGYEALRATTELVIAATPQRAERAENRQTRLAGALEQIMETDRALDEAKETIADQRQQINEQLAMIEHLDRRLREIDADRVLYARQSAVMAKTIRTIRQMSEEAVFLAEQAEAVEKASE